MNILFHVDKEENTNLFEVLSSFQEEFGYEWIQLPKLGNSKIEGYFFDDTDNAIVCLNKFLQDKEFRKNINFVSKEINNKILSIQEVHDVLDIISKEYDENNVKCLIVS